MKGKDTIEKLNKAKKIIFLKIISKPLTIVINNVVRKGNITMGKLEIKKRIREYNQQLCQRF